MQIINSKEIREKAIKKLQKQVKTMRKVPKLAIVQMNDDPASNSYIKNKIKLGERIGVDVELHKHKCAMTSTAVEIVKNIIKSDNNIDGIIVQLPLPSSINEKDVLNAIDPTKDVDGLTSSQQGMLLNGDCNAFPPCTAKGVINMLKSITTLEGKDVVVINRSHLIGLPLQTLLMKENATVMVCHSKTKDLIGKTKRADIIITGIGHAKYFDKSYFKDGQIIIDCSMNMDNGKLVGDVDVDTLNDLDVLVASGTGHTGPFTVLSLIENTVKAATMHK